MRRINQHTAAVHAGREEFRRLGVHAPPIDLSTTYPFQDLAEATESLDCLVAGDSKAANPVYARLFNPTVARLENAIAELENADACVAYSSGMAALTACLLVARQRGTHVVAVRPIYGTTDHLLSSDLLGMSVTWTSADQVAAAIRPDTSLVVVETPGNPTIELLDIAAVVQQADGIPVLVDSTFATPILQQPLLHGATYSVHSATKFIGGHGDVIGGLVCAAESDAAKLRQVRLATGSLLHPLAAYLLHRSLPTLPLRVERAQETAMKIADRLSRHPNVGRVMYPGLPTCDPNRLVGRQMSGPGAILSFELSADGLRGQGSDTARIHAGVSHLMQALALITPAVSLGSTDTLIQHPAGLTHRVVSAEAQLEGGITPALVRLSIGLEDVEDLWTDLEQALAEAGRWARGSGIGKQESGSGDGARERVALHSRTAAARRSTSDLRATTP